MHSDGWGNHHGRGVRSYAGGAETAQYAFQKVLGRGCRGVPAKDMVSSSTKFSLQPCSSHTTQGAASRHVPPRILSCRSDQSDLAARGHDLEQG